MELSDRYSVEAANASLLARLMNEQRRRIEAELRDAGPNVGVSEAEWSREQEELEALLLLLLIAVYTQTATEINQHEGFGIPNTELQRLAREWAKPTAETWAAKIVADTRERVESWIESIDPGVGPADMFADLVVIYGPARIENIAITETTRGQTAGVRDIYRHQAGRLDAIAVAVWRTELDGSVCPICLPMEGRPEAEWPEELRDGPPAHPRCRCHLDWRFEYRKF